MLKKLHTILISGACLLATPQLRAQYVQFLPDMVSYINADVNADATGTTFRITYQDTTLAIHRVLLRTDNNGTPQWAAKTNNYGQHAFASDSSMISTGGLRLSNGSNVGMIQRNDKAGNHLWTKRAKGSSDLSLSNVMVNDSDIIYVTAVASSFSSSTYYSKSAVIAYDLSGTRLWTKYFSNPTFTVDYHFSRTLLAANGDFIGVADIRGSMSKQANGMMVTRITQQGNVVFSRYFNFYETHNQLSVTGLAETANGDIVIGGRLMTDQISTYPNKMWMARLDANGITQIQKIYHAGTDVGEQLHSLQYKDDKLYAYLHIYSPFDTPARSFWVAEIDAQNLSVISHNALDAAVTSEDPYGNVADAFCITADGKPTFVGGVYCEERQKNIPVIGQFSATLGSSCTALEITKPLIDSISFYTDTTYIPSGTFTVTMSDDSARISFTPLPLPEMGNLCTGCVIIPTNSIASVNSTQHLKVYPNPGDGIFQVDYTAASINATITVYNSVGIVVYSSVLNGNNKTINLSQQPTGMYYLRLHDGDNIQAAKLIKQ